MSTHKHTSTHRYTDTHAESHTHTHTHTHKHKHRHIHTQTLRKSKRAYTQSMHTQDIILTDIFPLPQIIIISIFSPLGKISWFVYVTNTFSCV